MNVSVVVSPVGCGVDGSGQANFAPKDGVRSMSVGAVSGVGNPQKISILR